jgi:ABC-type polysaccharide/polyol phosphate transport system ATPase subunit
MGDRQTPVINVENASKYFNINVQEPSKGKMDGFESVRKIKRPAVKQASLALYSGEWVGLVGENGSGKSTLLKMVGGYYGPDEGTIEVGGAVLPFFGPDEELHPEGQVQDAIMVKALQVGLPRSEALKIYEKIISFSRLHEFRSQKIKQLSTGMKTRLMLGLMLNINADVYLFDEIPATTDIKFQQKVEQRLNRLKEMNKSALVVSHNIDELRELCPNSILMHNGEIVAYDNTDTVLRMYAES